MRTHTRILTPALTAAFLILTPTVLADSGGNPAARASGEVVGGSVEAGATLASAGVSVTAATVVLVAGSTAAVATGNGELADNTLDFAADIAASPFATGKPLDIDADIIIPAPAPALPYHTPASGH